MTHFFQEGGGGLPENHPAYVLRHNLDNHAFNVALTGELFHVIAPPQVGKTSLLKRLRARLIESRWRCVIIDLSALRGLSMTAWYSALGQGLAAGLTPGIPVTLTNQVNMSAYLTGEAMHERYGFPRIAVFFDEVESITKVRDEQGQPFSDAFFMAIRDIYQTRDTRAGLLAIGLAGAVSANHLVKEQVPDRSPFNTGIPLDIDDFTRGETRVFTNDLNKLNVQVDEAVHEEIYTWTSGYPYLTHRICAELEKGVEVGQLRAITVDDVRDIVKHIFLQPSNPLLEDTNIRHATRMLNSLHPPAQPFWEKIRQGINTSRGSVDIETFTELYMTGVIKSQDERLVFRNRIYEEVFTVKNLIERETEMDNKLHQSPEITAVGEGLEKQEKLERVSELNEPVSIKQQGLRASEEQGIRVKREEKDKLSVSPWKSGSFYLITAVAVIAMLCLAASLMPWYYFPVAIIGWVIVVSVIGAFQLRQDQGVDQKTFLELVRLSLRSLFLLRHRDVKPENVDK